jgi:predicted glycogen debranching enzyme
MILEFGRQICGNFQEASRREWLITNGIGGYAAGTIAGVRTRRYHGLLVGALKPPLGRTLLLSSLDERVEYLGQTCPLFTNQWGEKDVEPRGFHHLERFHLEGTTPVWTFAVGDALLEKRVWMEQGANTTYIRYRVLRGTEPLDLTLKAVVNQRDHHAVTRAGAWEMRVEPVPKGLRLAVQEERPFYLLSRDARVDPREEWYEGYYLSLEDERGLDVLDDNFHAGDFHAVLSPGESITVVASTRADPALEGAKAFADRRAYERALLERSPLKQAPLPIQRLTLAADQFLVRRPTPEAPDGTSVIAGYPWFADWGRDTMIALPGLTLATGRPEVARGILKTYAHYVDRGMLPNRFPERGETPEYNTVDATLWYFEALRAYRAWTGDADLIRELFPILAEIIAWHQRGTRYGIQVDPEDGLLSAGEAGLQLTWMDAKVDDWVVTPRVGKPVEINALWYNALRVMADFARDTGVEARLYQQEAERVRKSFERFWNSSVGYCYDVIDGSAGDDPALRPNQLFAVSLLHSPLNQEQAQAVVEACARHLLTSHGLRSLAPFEPGYEGHYGGGRRERDGSYHQGTVWGWLIGPFVLAHLRVYRDPAAARAYLAPLLRHLRAHGVGTISEIFDGDPPFLPRGTFAQAWSVAEVLRAWFETEER